MAKYRLASAEFVYAPNMIAFAINGAKFEKDRQEMIRVVAKGWNIPFGAAMALGAGASALQGGRRRRRLRSGYCAMNRKYTVLLFFDNEFMNDRNSFDHFNEALEFCRNSVSLTGPIYRMEIRPRNGCVRAMWDRRWTPLSRALLFKDYA